MNLSRFRRLRNAWSVLGLSMTLSALLLYLVLLLQELAKGRSNPYLDIAFTVALPLFILVGLGLAWYGARRNGRRLSQLGPSPHGPATAGRSRLWVAAATLAFVIPLACATYLGYSGYQYTESVNFCGTTCHVPMKPTFVAHQYSPHASVDCATCHIGEGAWHFVKSKFTG